MLKSCVTDIAYGAVWATNEKIVNSAEESYRSQALEGIGVNQFRKKWVFIKCSNLYWRRKFIKRRIA